MNLNYGEDNGKPLLTKKKTPQKTKNKKKNNKKPTRVMQGILIKEAMESHDRPIPRRKTALPIPF